MSRLALILRIVDKLEARSNDILSTVEDSNRLINHLVSMNEEISTMDSRIDDIGDLLSDNTRNIHEFSSLYEKSFYLESNLHVNDSVTNQTSFETLTNEFQYLVKRLERNDYYSRAPFNAQEHEQEHDQELEQEHEQQHGHYEYKQDAARDELHEETHAPAIPRIQNKVSLSNLKLKPIRCNSRKIYKKKSRYRLSGIYNINPIAYEEVLSGLEESDIEEKDEVNDMNEESSFQKPFSDYNYLDQFNTPFKTIPSISDHTNTSSNIMHNEDHIYEDPDEISFQPEELNSLASSPNETVIHKRIRSNSLPESHHKIDEDSDEKLRMNRLKSFISYHNIHRSFEIHHDPIPKSPPTTLIDDDFDNISVCSDLSYYSPAKQAPNQDVQDDFDNFEKYLRQSRVDLKDAFPNIKKSTSHESIFEPKPKPFKFHNPAASMLASSKVSEATVFYTSEPTRKKSVSFAETQDPKKYLSEMIQRNPKPVAPPEPSSSFNNFSIFFSPSKPKPKQEQKVDERRNSIDHISRSLTDSFMNLVNTSTTKPRKLTYPEKKQRELDLKMNAKTQGVPISIENEIQAKRLPIRIPRNDGASSQLTIGPNNTKIINHGDGSAFKRPMMTSMSRRSLRDALSSSII